MWLRGKQPNNKLWRQTQMTNANIYEMVTNAIIEKLEAGIVPWRKAWVDGGTNQAVSWETQKPYRGINAMMLDAGEYATFNQIKKAGGKVIKGAKAQLVVFWKWIEKENEKKEVEKIPFLRYYNVFNIATQVTGLESKRKPVQSFEHDAIEACENVIKGYANSPDYTFQSGVGAWYKPSMDVINMPKIKDFKQVEEYYTTFFHEMIHSTGHKSRLAREGVTGLASFGSETYSKEELIAELGAQMIASMTGVDNSTIDNATAYIGSWLKALKDDKTLLVQAGAKAQRAVDYILGTKFGEEA
jgi:antirestriction protein ArdC